MRLFKTLSLSIIIPLLFAVVPAAAQPFAGPGGGYYSGLGLSSSQIDQISELRFSFQEQILPLRNDLQTGYIKLRNIYWQDSGSAEADAVRNEIIQVQQELESLYMEYQDQVRALLTEEQRALFDSWLLAGSGLRGPGWGGRGWRGGRFRGGGGAANTWAPAAGPGSGLGLGPGMGPGLGAGAGFGAGTGRGWRCPGRWGLW